MANIVDISKITGINQVGNSYQRKSAVPLDYYSLFNTKAEAEAYASSNPVSYVGQVISYIDNNEVKVCVIADAAGTLKEVGTAPRGDDKTIEVSAEGAVALLGGKDAATGTLPMIGDDGKLTWKTLEQIGAGDGNDNTTYEFSFAEQKITIKPLFNGQPIKVKDEEGNDTEEIVTHVLDLSSFVTADELTEALNALPKDKNTTYSLTQEDMVLTLTPSEGEADVVTIDAYSKSEIDDKFAALPEDKDTTYTAKADDKVLTLSGTEFSTEIGLKHENGKISLTGKGGEVIAEFSDAEFVADGVLEDVSYDDTTKELTFTWNLIGEDGKAKTDVINIADLIDTYTAGNGLSLSNAGEFSVAIASDSEAFLSVDANGVKLSGVQDAIDAAKQAAIDDAKKYAEATSVYTKEEADGLLANKANSADVYTKTAADELLNAKANSADVYTKIETDNLLGAKANVADVYAKSETYTQKQVDDLLEGIQAGSSESAASVNTKLEALKKTLNNEIYGNDEGTGDSRIDAAETKLATIAEGAQVNVIESVVVNNGEGEDTPAPMLTASKSGKTVTLNDASLQAAIKLAKQAGTDAGTVASRAEAVASQNTQAIQGHDTKITGLETLTGQHTTDIANLQLADTTHAAEFEALSGTVATHGSDIASLKTGKADTTVTDALAGRITANENAIKTLNETTIPGINGTIDLKANSADVYDKTTVDAKLKEITDAAYDDTAVRELIADNASAIAAIYNVDGETKSGVLVDEIARVEGLVATEKSRAEGIEADHEERIAEMEKFWEAADDPAGTIDKLAEIVDYIAKDESGALDMAADIEENAKAIAAIYTPAEGETAASGVLVTEIARIENAYAEADVVILAEAQKHTNNAIAALLVKDVDNKTIKLNEGKAYVAEVSTDLLVQGTAELHLVAGDASV